MRSGSRGRSGRSPTLTFSEVAIAKGQRIAAHHEVHVDWIVVDVTEWEPPAEAYDLVIVSYLQLLAPTAAGGASSRRLGGHHALIVGEILAKLDYLDDAIARVSAEIDRVIAPFADQRDLLMTIPGVHQRTAEALIAEIGVDMARFGSAQRLAYAPASTSPPASPSPGQTRKGSKWLHAHLNQAAKAAARTKGTYLRAQYYRLKGRRGHAKATVAVEHSILVVAYQILDRGVTYHDLGEDWFTRRHDPGRRARTLAAQIRALGFDVELTQAA